MKDTRLRQALVKVTRFLDRIDKLIGRITPIALVVTAVALLLLAWQPLAFSLKVIADIPWQLDREEGFLLEQAVRLRAGETIYPDLSLGTRLTVGNYPPMYPMLYAGALSVTDNLLGAGRALTLVAAVVIAALLAALGWKVARRAEVAMLAPALFLITSDLNYWLPFARVDLPALAFSLAGAWVITKWEGHRWAMLAGVLFVLGIFTKQTALPIPVAAIIALLWCGERGRAGILTATMALVGGVFGIALLALTRGQAWLHLVTYNANAFDWFNVKVIVRHLYLFQGWMLLAAPVAVWVLVRQGPKGHQGPEGQELGDTVPKRFLAIALLLTALNIIASGKVGSDRNYLLEFDALLGLVVAIAVACSDGIRRAVLLFCVVAHGCWAWTPLMRAITYGHGVGEVDSHAADGLLLRVATTEGPVLCEEAWYAVAAHKPVTYQPFIMATLAREGKWDEAPFVARLRDREFALIVTVDDLARDGVHPGFTDRMRETILGGYVQEGTYAIPGSTSPVFVYVPRTQRRESISP